MKFEYRLAARFALLLAPVLACDAVGDIGGVGGGGSTSGNDAGLPIHVGSGGAGDGNTTGTGVGTGGVTGTGTGTGTGGNGTAASGVPCDVQSLLNTRCVICHGAPPLAGVPVSMMTLMDLTAPARSDPSRTVAGMAMARMQDNARPMPPAPSARATAAEIAA